MSSPPWIALQPGIAALALPALQSVQPPSIEVAAHGVLNALSTLPADAVLVLDDYHVLQSPAIHAGMTFLLDHLPPQLHLVIATREDPPLPLARLRARGQLTELRAADLRFTAEEAAAFLQTVMGLPLSAAEVAALEAQTEGWIAGLQLAALAHARRRPILRGFIRTFTGSHRYVLDYLADEVIAAACRSTCRPLCSTPPILDRMCGSALRCRRAGGSGIARGTTAGLAAQAVLEELERANLFRRAAGRRAPVVSLPSPLCRGAAAALTAAPRSATVAALHRRASAWFEAQGLVAEAVQHALAAAEWARAAG